MEFFSRPIDTNRDEPYHLWTSLVFVVNKPSLLWGCDLQPHTHPTGSLRVPQCSVRWKAHMPTSPLNDRAADHFKQATQSKTFHLLVEGCWSHWAGTLESCLGLWTHVCVCKCNVFYCVYSLWVHVYARTDLCCQEPSHKCVCVCTSVHMSALEFFCPAVWNTADVFSSPPRKPPPLSPSLSSHSHLARSSAHTPQCLYATALQIISWLHYLSPSFLWLYLHSSLPSLCTLQNMLWLGISLSWTCPN